MLINAQGLAGQEPFAVGVDMRMDADPPQVGDAGHIAGGDEFLAVVPALVFGPYQHVLSSSPVDASVEALIEDCNYGHS